MWNKGRGVGPIDNSKLIEIEVLQIRDMYASGNFTQKELGKIYKVEDTTICNIVNRQTWAHI